MMSTVVRPQDRMAQDVGFFSRLYWWALACYGVLLWPIIQAQAYYVDDLGRAETGFLGWSQDGRPLSNVLMEALNVGTPMTDMAPLTQLGAIALLAYATVRLARHFELQSLPVALLVAFPLGASPFYLENLSYRFDALPMAMAVLLAVWPATVRADSVKRVLWGAFLLLASLCFYQPAVNVFIVYAVAEALVMMHRGVQWTTLLRTGALRIGQLGASLFFYTFIVEWKVRGDYAETHGQLAADSVSATFIRNFQQFWNLVSESFTQGWGGVLMTYLAAGALLAVVLCAMYARQAWRRGDRASTLYGLVMMVAVPAVLAVAPWGPMLLLDKPVFNPRIMVGFGAVLSLALLVIALMLPTVRVKSSIQTAVVALPCTLLLMFAFIYGNALRVQSEQTARVSTQLASDVERLSFAHPEVERYTIHGVLRRPNIVSHDIDKYPLIARLVPVILNDYWGWAGAHLRMYGMQMKGVWGWEGTLPPRDSVCGLTPFAVHPYYRLYVVDRLAVIVFPSEGQCG